MLKQLPIVSKQWIASVKVFNTAARFQVTVVLFFSRV